MTYCQDFFPLDLLEEKMKDTPKFLSLQSRELKDLYAFDNAYGQWLII